VEAANRFNPGLHIAVMREDDDMLSMSRDLSRIMGTSVTQIDATYGHLVPDSEEYLRGLLDAYDADAGEAAAQSG
jgi:hypothetical protein